jgi:hypothetical protein
MYRQPRFAQRAPMARVIVLFAGSVKVFFLSSMVGDAPQS